MEISETSADIRRTGAKRAIAGTALSVARIGERNIIQSVSGKEETCRFLGNLGFVSGQRVTVVKESGGDIIVDVLGSRVAIGRSQARRITVMPECAV